MSLGTRTVCLFYLPGDKLSLLITGATEPTDERVLFIIYSLTMLEFLNEVAFSVVERSHNIENHASS